MRKLEKAFRHRSVFVTGHTGFKGSWLCLWLEQLGARVTGYALAPPTEPSNFEVCGVRDVLDRSYEEDIRDPSTQTSGAYARTASPLGFLSRPAPPEVWVDGSRHSMIRRRGRLQDLLHDQQVNPSVANNRA